MKKISLTFDLDCTDYLSGQVFDEMEVSFPVIRDILMKRQDLKTTWFMRMDSQIEQVFEKADYFFVKHRKKLDWLEENGHEIAWHHHSYRNEKGKWLQDTQEQTISGDLRKYGARALELGISSVRMGWGFQTNETIKVLDELGFGIDSSAIPRPVYKWEMSLKNWVGTSQKAYHPGVNDYRLPGTPHLGILEYPINTVHIPVATDTEPGVLRYIDPAYHHGAFKKAVGDYLSTEDCLVMVCHPYELLPNKNTHSLLAFDAGVFEQNLFSLESSMCMADLPGLE